MDGISARATLGLCPDADQHDVKSRYRLLAKASHPDRGGDPAWFDALTRAYGVALATPPIGKRPHPFLLQTSMQPVPPAPAKPTRRRRRDQPVSFADELRRAMESAARRR